MKVINFPVLYIGKDGRGHCYGGREFETEQDVFDAMSDRDWRRFTQWVSRHAARIERKAKEKRA